MDRPAKGFRVAGQYRVVCYYFDLTGWGRGAEFVVRLPLATHVEAPEDTDVPGPAKAVGAERTLVIDDNVDAADSLAQLLRLRGPGVRAAYGGEEGLDAAAMFRPNLVLLDLGMPRVHGCAVARRLRAMEGGSAVILVAVSGWTQTADRRRTAAAGIDYHLTNRWSRSSSSRPSSRRGGGTLLHDHRDGRAGNLGNWSPGGLRGRRARRFPFPARRPRGPPPRPRSAISRSFLQGHWFNGDGLVVH